MATFDEIFTPDRMTTLFPRERADAFFEALFGDVSEGAYDISIAYRTERDNQLVFEFVLDQRPGKCLVCSLTYGLPEVFSRHPIIDVKGLVADIDAAIGDAGTCSGWSLGATRELDRSRHVVPLFVELAA